MKHKKISSTLFSLNKNFNQFKTKRVGVYHYHIRKTGGTSLNKAFIKSFCKINADQGYSKVMKEKDRRLIYNNNVIIAHNKLLLKLGNYDFGFSHIPFHELNVPEYMFRITCLRDPVKRLVSHYKMIKSYSLNKRIFREDLERESKWLGSSLEDFIQNMPRKHRERQLYMFSKNYEVEEAIININKLEFNFEVQQLNC